MGAQPCKNLHRKERLPGKKNHMILCGVTVKKTQVITTILPGRGLSIESVLCFCKALEPGQENI